MPVARRACNYCREHKLRCEGLEDLSGCAQCRARKMVCMMPSSSSRDTNQAAAESDMRVHAASQQLTLEKRPRCADFSSSQSLRVEDQIKQLERSILELRNLLPFATGTSKSVNRSENAATVSSASLSPTEELEAERTTNLEENRDISSFQQPSGSEDPSSSTVNSQNVPRIHFSLPTYQRAAREETFGISLSIRPTVRLQNCAKGKCFLPPSHEGVTLVTEYLRDFNSSIPLFHPETIYNYVRDCYSGEADRTPLSWVLAYIALGIAHRLRAMSPIAAANDIFNAEYYLNRCISVLPDLLLQEPSLPLIQALLGVSILLQTSDKARKAAQFVSTAMQMAQHLAYNETISDTYEESLKSNQGIQVFWIAFFLDTSLSLRALRPNTQKLIDINVPVPDSAAMESWASYNFDSDTGRTKINTFPLHVSLALIQAEALEDLFSAKARRISTNLGGNDFRRILAKLEAWKAANPLAVADASTILRSMYQSDVVLSILLEAFYFETLYQLHAAEALGACSHRLDISTTQGLEAAAWIMPFDVYTDAQRLLMYAGLISYGGVSVAWAMSHALIPAVCTVLACHLREDAARDQRPNLSNLPADIDLCRESLEVLELVAVQANDAKLDADIDFGRQLYTRALRRVQHSRAS